MGLHSGKFGVVDGQSTVRNWQVSDTMEVKEFFASNTRAGAGRQTSVRDWTGSFNSYGAEPQVFPGEHFDFKGFTAPSNGAEFGGTGTTYSGLAIVENVAVTLNWENGDIISYAVNFAGSSPLVHAIENAIYDETTPDVPTVCGGKVEFDDGGGWEEWPNITQAVLTLTSTNATSVNSSTDCWRHRQRGPFTWTLALTEHETDRHELPDIGDIVKIRLYVNASDYWLLDAAMLSDYSSINVDRETGAIISRTCNLGMHGVANGIGSVVAPSGYQVWPFASSSSSGA